MSPAATARPTGDVLLYLNGVTVSFDGFKALNELSLVVEEGELRTIIGPNGAGKTTMMDRMRARCSSAATKI
jgi:urea transport system ATP-binding protein